jgi:hypothetical protein
MLNEVDKMLKDDLHEFVSELSANELVYLLYKNHIYYHNLKESKT